MCQFYLQSIVTDPETVGAMTSGRLILTVYMHVRQPVVLTVGADPYNTVVTNAG